MIDTGPYLQVSTLKGLVKLTSFLLHHRPIIPPVPQEVVHDELRVWQDPHRWLRSLVCMLENSELWSLEAVENIIGALGQHKYGKETRTKIQEMTINDGPGGFFAFKEDALWCAVSAICGPFDGAGNLTRSLLQIGVCLAFRVLSFVLRMGHRFADQQYGYFCNMLHDQDVPESQRLYLAACRQLLVAQEVSEKYLQRQLGEPLKTAMQDPLLCPSRHVADAIKHALEIGSTLLRKLRLPMKHMAKAKETLQESAAASVRDALRLLHKDEEVSRLMTIRGDPVCHVNKSIPSQWTFSSV